MKSAYELAMERLKRDDAEPSKPLTDAQKAQLADIEQRFKAKIAGREIFLQREIDAARARRDAEAMRDLEKQLVNERLTLQEDMESAKEKVRQG
jgi:hypothetical protein